TDIKTEDEKRREIEDQMTALTDPATALTEVGGVDPKTIGRIEAARITSLDKLAGMTPEQLMEIPGIGEKMVDKIYQAVNRFYEGGEAAVAGEGGETAETAEAETAEATEAVAEDGVAAENGVSAEEGAEQATASAEVADER